MESWKSIDEYSDYEVSTLGRVRRGERMLKPGLTKRGYMLVELWANSIGKSKMVHRLVALAFIPNPDNKKEVDHINRIRTDNRIENMRWATRSENAINVPTRAKHRHIINKASGSYRVQIRRNNNWVFIKTYATLDEAIAGRDAFLTKESSCHDPSSAASP